MPSNANDAPDHDPPNTVTDTDTATDIDTPPLLEHFPADQAGTLDRLLKHVIVTLSERPGLALHTITQPQSGGEGLKTITVTGDNAPTDPVDTLEHRATTVITRFAPAAESDGWLPGHVTRGPGFFGQFIGGAVVVAARELDIPIQDSEVADAVQHAFSVVFPDTELSGEDAKPLSASWIMKMKRKYDEAAGEWTPPVAVEHFITRYGRALHLHPDTVAAAREYAAEITTTDAPGARAASGILAGLHATGEPRTISSIEYVTSLTHNRITMHVPEGVRDSDRPRISMFRHPRPAEDAPVKMFDARDEFVTIPRIVVDWLDLDGVVLEWRVESERDEQTGAPRLIHSDGEGNYQHDPGRVLLSLTPTGDTIEDVLIGDAADADGDAAVVDLSGVHSDAILGFATPGDPSYERAGGTEGDVIRFGIPDELRDVFPDEFLWDWDWDWDADDPRTSRDSRLILREVPE